jgi:hypothetical protein
MSPRLARQSTVPARKPARRPGTPPPPKGKLPPPPPRVNLPKRNERVVARILDQSETSLVDVIDNLLNRGVVLTADLILALADVDLVYIRLSALLCAADRILPHRGVREPGTGIRSTKPGRK